MWSRYSRQLQRQRAWQLLNFVLGFLICQIILRDITSLKLYSGHAPTAAGESSVCMPSAFYSSKAVTLRTSASAHVMPRVVFAAAAFTTPNAQVDRIYPDEPKAFSYDAHLKPFLVPWHKLRTTMRQSGCFATRALPRLTDTVEHDFSHSTAAGAATTLINRTDPSVSLLALPAVCRKPVVLFSGRTRDCPSCNYFTKDVLSRYAAEWAYIRAHVTLVDAGDPMSEQLVRYPYPLWYDEAAVARLLALQPRFNASALLSEEDGEKDRRRRPNGMETPAVGEDDKKRMSKTARKRSGGDATQLADAAADYALFTASLRRKAALLVKAPVAQAGHRWSRLVRRTFANPSEYVLRVVFMYPHNGSIMRDVVNEGIFDGSSPDYLHFYTNSKYFFRAVKKAVRVMEWLEHYGDY